MPKLTSNQYYSFVVLVFSLVYLYLGLQIQVGFFNGIVGPHHWVIGVACSLIFFSVFLYFSDKKFIGKFPKKNEWLQVIPFSLTILLYAKTLPLLGFLITTPLLMITTGYFFNAKITKSIVSAVLMTVFCYLLFTVLLKISLPSGLWLRNV